MAGNSNSGRPRKPASLKLVEGTATRKDFEAATAARADLPAEIPPCPVELSGYAREEWERISPVLLQLELITALDRGALALYCQAWGDWRHLREVYVRLNGDGDGMLAPHTAKKVDRLDRKIRMAETRIRFALSDFGLTPATRARLLEATRQPGLFDGSPQDAAASYFSR